MGLCKVLRSSPPDVVVSGINHGPNLANDVHYSGTPSSAPSMAAATVPE